jgi:hypothetical protein
MADDSGDGSGGPKVPEDAGGPPDPATASGIADFVRRAVAASVGVAAKSKDDIMRAAGGEMRAWLDHLNLSDELAKALTRLVVEVKTEIRFRPNDEGKLVPEAVNDVKLKGSRT